MFNSENNLLKSNYNKSTQVEPRLSTKEKLGIGIGLAVSSFATLYLLSNSTNQKNSTAPLPLLNKSSCTAITFQSLFSSSETLPVNLTCSPAEAPSVFNNNQIPRLLGPTNNVTCSANEFKNFSSSNAISTNFQNHNNTFPLPSNPNSDNSFVEGEKTQPNLFSNLNLLPLNLTSNKECFVNNSNDNFSLLEKKLSLLNQPFNRKITSILPHNPSYPFENPVIDNKAFETFNINKKTPLSNTNSQSLLSIIYALNSKFVLPFLVPMAIPLALANSLLNKFKANTLNVVDEKPKNETEKSHNKKRRTPPSPTSSSLNQGRSDSHTLAKPDGNAPTRQLEEEAQKKLKRSLQIHPETLPLSTTTLSEEEESTTDTLAATTPASSQPSTPNLELENITLNQPSASSSSTPSLALNEEEEDTTDTPPATTPASSQPSTPTPTLEEEDNAYDQPPTSVDLSESHIAELWDKLTKKGLPSHQELEKAIKEFRDET